MAYILDSVSLRRPASIKEANTTQYAQQRTLSGAVGRDYFGNNKRVWVLAYDNVNPTDFSAINTIYQSYLTNGTAKTWQVTESNYPVSSTTVHVDLIERNFGVKGTDYLSDFDLVLTEA